MRELGEEGSHLIYMLKDCLAGVEREGKKEQQKVTTQVSQETNDGENQMWQSQDIAQHLHRLLPHVEGKKRDPSRKSPQALHRGADRTQLSFTSK